MQGGKNRILQKYMNANRFFRDSHWLEIWKNHFCPSMGPNGGGRGYGLRTLVCTFHLIEGFCDSGTVFIQDGLLAMDLISKELKNT
jgi:hypothetical protein